MTGLCDIYQYFGGDISPSNSGDLQPVTGTDRGQQRVLRRLMTNPADYIFHPDYGAGLPQWIGRPADLAEIRALIVGQLALEASVAQTPPPTVVVGPIANPAGGGFAVSIKYADAVSGQPVSLAFEVTE